MNFYERHILPHVINCACGTKPVRRQRQKVVPRARGVVLEIGIGTGLNLPFYNGEAVERLVGLDPSEASWALAAERGRDLPFPVEFIGLPGEEIPLADNSVDCIVMTFSLCTIPAPLDALAGMALAPLVFPTAKYRTGPASVRSESSCCALRTPGKRSYCAAPWLGNNSGRTATP